MDGQSESANLVGHTLDPVETTTTIIIDYRVVSVVARVVFLWYLS